MDIKKYDETLWKHPWHYVYGHIQIPGISFAAKKKREKFWIFNGEFKFFFIFFFSLLEKFYSNSRGTHIFSVRKTILKLFFYSRRPRICTNKFFFSLWVHAQHCAIFYVAPSKGHRRNKNLWQHWGISFNLLNPHWDDAITGDFYLFIY